MEHLTELRDGRLDLALLPMLEPFRAGVVSKEVVTMRLALAVRTDDPLARAVDVDYRELAGRNVMDFPEHWGNRVIVDRLLHDAGVERQVTVEVVDFASALDMVRARLELAFVPENALDGHHDLARVDLHRPPPRIGLGVTSLDDRPLSAATRALREAFK